MGALIINMMNGVIHLFRALIWAQINIWLTLTILGVLVAAVLSWQILQLIDIQHINYGFQLGGLWVITTAILDFFLYILPREGSITSAYAQLSNTLLLYYSLILGIPTLVGIVHAIRAKERN